MCTKSEASWNHFGKVWGRGEVSFHEFSDLRRFADVGRRTTAEAWGLGAWAVGLGAGGVGDAGGRGAAGCLGRLACSAGGARRSTRACRRRANFDAVLNNSI